MKHLTKKHLLALFFVIITIKGISQDTINSATVEQKSYQLYLDKNWTELIKFGNKALDKGFDYYYLRLRIGIAYYEKKNYSIALGHFKNVLKFNTSDELALEYIYYCYLNNGRYEDARVWSKQFNQALSEKLETDKQRSVSLIMIEAGTKITDSTSYYNKDKKTSSNYFNPPIYFQLGLNHYIKNRFSLFHAVTYFNQESFINKVGQFQYYIKANIPVKNNWLISPGIHWINIKNTTEIMPPPPSAGNPPPRRVKTITKSNYFVGSLSVQKIVNKFVFGAGTTVSNMNSVTQYIHSGFTSYSPLGNSKLVFGCTAYAHTSDNYSTTYASASPFIYIQPVNRVSLKLSYLYNTKHNIIEDNGYLVNNSPDITTARYSGLLNITINKHIGIYGLYQLEYKQENVQLFNYRYNVLVAGIKITP